jgi:hypothetical protein
MRMSWATAIAMFLLMTVIEFGLNMIVFPSFRHQAGSMQSVLWRIVIPVDLVANILLVLAMRFVVSRYCIGSNRAKL